MNLPNKLTASRFALTVAFLVVIFSEMRLHRVEADVDPENEASLRLLGRLGFREEGRLAERWFTYGAWRDSVLLGLLARDYDADPPGEDSPGEDSAEGQSPSTRRSATT